MLAHQDKPFIKRSIGGQFAMVNLKTTRQLSPQILSGAFFAIEMRLWSINRKCGELQFFQEPTNAISTLKVSLRLAMVRVSPCLQDFCWSPAGSFFMREAQSILESQTFNRKQTDHNRTQPRRLLSYLLGRKAVFENSPQTIECTRSAETTWRHTSLLVMDRVVELKNRIAQNTANCSLTKSHIAPQAAKIRLSNREQHNKSCTVPYCTA